MKLTTLAAALVVTVVFAQSAHALKRHERPDLLWCEALFAIRDVVRCVPVHREEAASEAARFHHPNRKCGDGAMMAPIICCSMKVC